jgi:hypothetical protein
MLRIASDFMARGNRTQVWESLGQVTLLSADPCESTSECRRLASEAGLAFNF